MKLQYFQSAKDNTAKDLSLELFMQIIQSKEIATTARKVLIAKGKDKRPSKGGSASEISRLLKSILCSHSICFKVIVGQLRREMRLPLL